MNAHPVTMAAPPVSGWDVGLRRWLPPLMVAAPLFWLLIPHLEFQSVDWENHRWLIAYQAEHWRGHGTPAEALSTTFLVGMPYPVFYGFLFYPAAGLLGCLIGADGALRVACFVVTAVQFGLCLRLFARVSRDWWLGLLVAAGACWATYSLTNLYHRAAIPEYIAISLLTSALCQLLSVALEEEWSRKRWLLAQTGLLFVIGAGTHPLTAVFGGCFLLVAGMSVGWMTGAWKQLMAAGAGCAAAAFVVLMPWLYATTKFRNELLIEKLITKSIGMTFNPERLDNLLVRLMPFPWDPVMGGPKRDGEAFPFIETQIAVVLLLLTLLVMGLALHGRSRGNAPRQERGGWTLCVGGFVLFAALLTLSVWPAVWAYLPKAAWNLQFPYRLVAYINLSLLVSLFGALMASGAGWAGRGGVRRVVLGALFGLATISLAIKLAHVGAVARKGPAADPASTVVNLPKGFYGFDAYAVGVTNQTLGEAEKYLRMKPGISGEFGKIKPLRLNILAPTSVLIPVQPFPWNRLLLNGREPEDRGIFSNGIVVNVPAGELQIDYRWEPDPLWRALKKLSWSVLLGWGVLMLVWKWRTREKLGG